MIQQRENWIDYVKVFACVLVAVGHFFMSMVESEILAVTRLYRWFIQSIYYFHVPLFFVCSGYLYQKKSAVKSFAAWKKNVINKAISLGVPYVVFTTITWILKEVFSGAVNTENQSLVVTLLLEPASPYWYLYTLFFAFLITLTFENRRQALVVMLAAIALKCARMTGILETNIYAIDQTFSQLIWFAGGMCLCNLTSIACAAVITGKKWV